MILALFLSLFPSFIGVPLRKLFGQKIGRSSRIRLGSILKAKDIEIGSNTSIGPFTCLIATKIKIGNNTEIKSLSITKANEITIGNDAQISPLAITNGPLIPKANLTIGNHSQIFPFCWLEPGEGIEIGNHVGVGGHTFIFTHGSWSNYLNGGPVSFGPVKIEDNVWLPWRVFILPNLTIGENVIIAAHSVVSKSILANSLAAGSPAKVIKEDFMIELSMEIKKKKLQEIIDSFRNYLIRIEKAINYEINISGSDKELILHFESNSYIDFDKLEYKAQGSELNEFIDFLRKYGIRLTRI